MSVVLRLFEPRPYAATLAGSLALIALGIHLHTPKEHTP